MLSILFLAILFIGSATSHDGKCPAHEEESLVADQFSDNGERVIIVEEQVIPTRSAVINGDQRVFVEKTEHIPGIKSSQANEKVIVGGPANDVNVEVPTIRTVPVNTKTFSGGQKILVEKIEQPVIKTLPVIVEKIEQFPSVKTVPVNVKTFVTGQKLITKDVDVPVESKFSGQKVVKVVHISKQVAHTSPEAKKLGLSSGVDTLFRNSKIDVSFSCHGKKYGYYADIKNECKIYHVCNEVALADGTVWNQRNSFTCPLGTIFDQQKVSCVDVATAMDCGQSELFYEHTAKLFATPAIQKKLDQKEVVPPVTPVKSCCVYPSCAYVFPCAI